MPVKATQIVHLQASPLNIPLIEPFTIATGQVTTVRNVLVTLTLASGIVGYGEAAPFPPSGGETQETALVTIQSAAELLKGRDAAAYRPLAALLSASFEAQASARAGIEMAIFDALGKTWGVPLYQLFGGADSQVETDLTIPIVPAAHAGKLAREIAARGIRMIKTKVGLNLEEDLARLVAIKEAAPQCSIQLDANQGYTAPQALYCLERLARAGLRPTLLEQPVPKSDLRGLRYVTEHTSVPVAADESVHTSHDAAQIVALGAANVINIKLMKSGIVDALDIAALCRSAHVQLMIGAMLESRLAITCAAHIAAGLGGFHYVDLDTPMLLAEDPFTGGYEQAGGIYRLDTVQAGIGVSPR